MSDERLTPSKILNEIAYLDFEPRGLGPRAPLPEADDSVAGQLIHLGQLANSRHHEIADLKDKLYAAEREARRYQKLFVGAVWISAVLGCALAIAIGNLWLS